MRPLIYTPSGPAGEYSKYAANLFHGCDHGCKYCYVPAQKKTSPEIFHSSVVPQPNVLARLANDCKKKYDQPIFLCFSCDPYPMNHEVHGITREAIRIIVDSGNAVNILTKGGYRAIQDFYLLARDPRNSIGATLTFVDDELSDKWEPNAELFDSRLHMLSAAKDMGISTWASMEPVCNPDETLQAIRLAAPYVDMFKVGRWNHSPDANKIDWKSFYEDALTLLNHIGAKYMFKDDLLKAVEKKP